MSNVLELLSVIFFCFSILSFLFSLLTQDIENKRMLQGINIGMTASALTLLVVSMSVIDKV